MKAIQIEQTDLNLNKAIANLQIIEKPIPKPKKGQVLIKIEAAPCNPSDLLFLQGKYGVKKSLPTVPGWEGAGKVVENGGGAFGWWLKGKRVACAGQSGGDGTWAEYFVADAKACIPLKENIEISQGATLIINPLTAYGMVEKAIIEKHNAVIQTAACSQVGRMVQFLCKQKNLPLINIVRRHEQMDELKSENQKWVLNSEEHDFFDQLKKNAKNLNATLALDAVAGEMSGKIMNAMPPKSKLLVYGALSETNCSNISPLSLIFEKKTLEGFWLSDWIEQSSFWHIVKTTQHLQQLIIDENFKTKIRETVSFEGWKAAITKYHNKMTSGKVILTP